MTGIPDEVIERVARAIAAVEYGNDAPDISISETHLGLASAALSASGWMEMREALTWALPFAEMHSLDQDAIDRARAALTIRRETGT